MEVQRGARGGVGEYLNADRALEIRMEVSGGAVYDYCCFGVDEAGRLSDERYMIFYNQTQSPGGEIAYTPEGLGAKFTVNLNALPASIQKLVFTVSIDGPGTMGEIASHTLRVLQNGRTALKTQLHGGDFQREKAIISMELYRKGAWRFAIVARGFDGGLGDLLRFYGGTEETEQAPRQSAPPSPEAQAPRRSAPPSPEPPAPPPDARRPPETPRQTVARFAEARAGEKILLGGHGALPGEIQARLQWKQPRNGAIDLDLGCLYELKNGRKGCVQALGGAFGNLFKPPFIALRSDDRTGGASEGEILRINGGMIANLRRILIYAFIYDGAADWKEASCSAAIRSPGNPDVLIRLDDRRSTLGTCTIALLENVRDEAFSVEKTVQFFDDHRGMDAAFHWGMQWRPGKK